MKILFVSLICLTNLIAKNTGRLGMDFIAFDNFTKVTTIGLQNKSNDIHPTLIEGKEIDDFVFNFGLITKVKCDRQAIACIKYKGDNHFYSISSAQSWTLSDAGSNVSFLSNISVKFSLPPSLGNNQSIFSKQIQLDMIFIYSEKSEMKLVALSPSRLQLSISNKKLNQFIFDYISLYCDFLKYVIANVLIGFGFFFLIPLPRLFKYQIFAMQIFLLSLFIILSVSYVIEQFFLMNYLEYSIISKVFVFGIFPLIFTLLLLFYLKFCTFWRTISDIEKDEKLRKALLLVPYYIFGMIIILNTSAYCFYINEYFGMIFFFFAVCLLLDCFDCYKFNILASSHRICGSYLFVRGFSIFIGGYPNEIEIIEKVESGIEYPLTYFCYLFIIILVPISFCIFISGENKYFKEIDMNALILENNINNEDNE